jgi:hypothetical protein
MYADYYMRQTQVGNGDMPVFVGARYQRGHGLGSILSGLFRRVLPFLKANATNAVSNLLRTGVDIAEDVWDKGKTFSESAKEQIPAGIKRTVQNINWQTGSGLGKRRRCKQKKPKAKRARITLRRQHRDIFG